MRPSGRPGGARREVAAAAQQARRDVADAALAHSHDCLPWKEGSGRSLERAVEVALLVALAARETVEVEAGHAAARAAVAAGAHVERGRRREQRAWVLQPLARLARAIAPLVVRILRNEVGALGEFALVRAAAAALGGGATPSLTSIGVRLKAIWPPCCWLPSERATCAPAPPPAARAAAAFIFSRRSASAFARSSLDCCSCRSIASRSRILRALLLLPPLLLGLALERSSRAGCERCSAPHLLYVHDRGRHPLAQLARGEAAPVGLHHLDRAAVTDLVGAAHPRAADVGGDRRAAAELPQRAASASSPRGRGAAHRRDRAGSATA